MARSDFNWITINHTFTINAPSVTKQFPVEGTQTPIDTAYLLIQAENVSLSSHKIFINNQELGGFDIPPESGWQTWMDSIPSGVLKAGTNSIRIDRIGEDDFHVYGVVVNWREP